MGFSDFLGRVEGMGVSRGMLFSAVVGKSVLEDVSFVGIELMTSGFERVFLLRCRNFACLAALCFPLLGISSSW
tara:strand:- start:384 stop:605 length:222 start_codon:yes stop_codon:yes gene_type:complete